MVVQTRGRRTCEKWPRSGANRAYMADNGELAEAGLQAVSGMLIAR